MICNKCKAEKNITEFRLRKSDGFLYKTCKECCYKKRKEWIKRNSALVLGEQQRARQNHIQLFRDKAKEYVMKHPEKIAARRLKNRFKLALYSSYHHSIERSYCRCIATEDEIKNAFTGYCAVCGCEETSEKLHMDHNHITGKFRGWLCSSCNIAAGKLKDDYTIAQKLSNYLKEKNLC